MGSTALASYDRPKWLLRAEEWLVRRAAERRACGPDGMPLPPPRLRLLVDGALGRPRSLPAGRPPDVRGHPRRRRGDGGASWSGCKRSSTSAAAAAGSPANGPRSPVPSCTAATTAASWSTGAPPTSAGCGRRATSRRRRFPRRQRQLRPDLRAFGLHPPRHKSSSTSGWRSSAAFLTPAACWSSASSGASVADRLGPAERSRFEAGEMVVQRPRLAGRNLCSVYHPRAYVEGTLLAGWDGCSPVRPRLPRAADLAVRLHRPPSLTS